MEFKVGDMAVYPVHGVGVIESVTTKEIAGSTQAYYQLRILNSDMTIMIPTGNAQRVGLRQVISHAEVPKVFAVLRKKNVRVDTQTWNRRYRDYTDKIKTGSVFEVAEVLRDLCILRAEKDLSFGERKMLDTAKNLLVKEVSIASTMNEEMVEAKINSFFPV